MSRNITAMMALHYDRAFHKACGFLSIWVGCFGLGNGLVGLSVESNTTLPSLLRTLGDFGWWALLAFVVLGVLAIADGVGQFMLAKWTFNQRVVKFRIAVYFPMSMMMALIFLVAIDKNNLSGAAFFSVFVWCSMFFILPIFVAFFKACMENARQRLELVGTMNQVVELQALADLQEEGLCD